MVARSYLRICFQSDEHWALVFMCILGILMYPVCILSVALRATIMYPNFACIGCSISGASRNLGVPTRVPTFKDCNHWGADKGHRS